ncbi:cation:proton antiporter [bacterium]|nr:cation:proton antiporter [bacterium]
MLNIYIYILIASCFMCFIRAWLGKTIPDRMVAIDILGTLAVGFAAVWALITKQDIYMDIALAWIFLSFLGTLALAKYLSHQSLDE